MYIAAPADPIYHLARTDNSALCGVMVFGKPEERRRRDDRRLVSEKPERQFVALCSTCERIANGTPKPQKPSPELVTPSRFLDIIV
jgi:hypothetical protein